MLIINRYTVRLGVSIPNDVKSTVTERSIVPNDHFTGLIRVSFDSWVGECLIDLSGKFEQFGE